MFITELINGNADHFFFVIFSVVFSVCLHEYAHAYAAMRLGDRTAADAGHLSLNPMIQMGPTSLILMLFMGIAFGSVPVNRDVLEQRKYGNLIVAIAGPLTNLALCCVSAIIAVMITRAGMDAGTFVHFLFTFSMLNGTLFLLNMLPIPVLDGYTVLEDLVPRLKEYDYSTTRQFGFYGIILVFVSPIGDLIQAGGLGIVMAFMRLGSIGL